MSAAAIPQGGRNPRSRSAFNLSRDAVRIIGNFAVHLIKSKNTGGLLARLPYQADLVVQGLPKIGLGGGPDAYFEVRDAGVLVAGTDEIGVDLTAIRMAGVPGNPWAFNHPIHGALQFGRGPMSWEEIRVVSREAAHG